MSEAEAAPSVEPEVAPAAEPAAPSEPAGETAPQLVPDAEADPVRRAYNEVISRPRDEKGKFISIDKPAEQPKTAIEQAQTVPPPAEAAPAAPAEVATPEWSNQLLKIAETVQPRLTASRMDFPTYVGNLAAADARLDADPDDAHLWLHQNYPLKQPVETIRRLIQGYRIDPHMLVGSAQPQPGGQPASPPDQWQATQASFQQQLETLQNQILAQNMDSQIKAFAAQTDKYPHFETVRPRMAELFNSGYAGQLEDAYNVAVYSDKALMAKIEADREKQRIDDAAKAAATARRAAGINVESTTATASPARKGNLNDTVAEVVRAAYRGRLGS